MTSASTGLVVIGDALLDRDIEGDVTRVCPDAPVPVLEQTSDSYRPGGASLAAVLAVALSGLGRSPITLVTSISADEAGRRLSALVEEAGIRIMSIPAEGPTTEKIRLRSNGQTLLRLDRGTGRVRFGKLPTQVAGLVDTASAILVADYGRGLTTLEPLRHALADSTRPIVWDPHPLGGQPVPGCRVLTPNVSELLSRFLTGPKDANATARSSLEDDTGTVGAMNLSRLTKAANDAKSHWMAASVAVTRGPLGALLVSTDGPPLVVPSPSPITGDTCGAGDCFAASTAVSLAQGALPSEAVTKAVTDAGSFVNCGAASAYRKWSDLCRGGHQPSHSLARRRDDDAEVRAAQVHRSGGTVVAAGGCFDLLHAGHVALLQAARRLGDCLIVCINSDESVRRLKGPGRPLNVEADRAATLAALDCVDAVEIFGEDTPETVIRRLRPDIWVKGGDYDARSLPEAATLASWGGQAAVLPYLAGHSTTGLAKRAAAAVS